MPVVLARVTFGDGRSPDFVAVAPDEMLGPVVEQPVAVVVAPALASSGPARVAVASSVPAIEGSPWPLSETPVASIWGKVEPGWPAGALFGLAGLLLAPIAGVWVGYRQARASRAASQLVRH
jgi:hypothetical protein